MENWFTPYQTRPLPTAQSVLVFAPHPDDEIFGCGGAVCLYRQQGVEVRVVVVTDGAANAPPNERPQIFATRQAETNAALASLKIPPAIFWGLPDRGIAASPGLPARMAALIQSHPFDVVFTPSLSEIHPDHKACTHAVLAALEQCQTQGRALPTVMLYEVGVPLLPNCLIDITPIWPLKQSAMQSFVSQQATQDYARQVEGLNTYRSYTLGAHVLQAEAYRWIPPEALWEETGLQATECEQRTSAHWRHTVLVAAEASNEAMHTQLVAQNRLVADLEASAKSEREQLWQQMVEARTDFNRQLNEIRADFKDQISQISLSRQHLQWQVDHQSQEISSLKHQINQQKTQLDERTDQLGALQWTTGHQATEITQLTLDIQQTHKQLQERQTELDKLTRSFWWRLGKPLRWASQRFQSRTD